MSYAKSTDRQRPILLGAMSSAYYEIATDEERARVIGRFRKLIDEWRTVGARLVGTLDDDLFMVGEPAGAGFTFTSSSTSTARKSSST